jgi:hypothetical protein
MLVFVFVLTVMLVGSGDCAAASGTCEERRGVCGVCAGGRESAGECWTQR